jgi:Peptidase M15
MRLLLLVLASVGLASGARAQELPDAGQSLPAYIARLAREPKFARDVAAFEAWLHAKRIDQVLPTWQILRTASMWQGCAGQAFEVPPRKYWHNVETTLRFIGTHVLPLIGPVQAVSAYRNPALNACAHGARGSAHRDFSAVDLVPLKAISRRQIMRRMCFLQRGKGEAAHLGLGFYAYTRFHVDTRSYRRWGSSGPQGNESPCAVIERGEDPDAPPPPPALPAPPTLPPPQPGPAPSR